MSTQNEVQTSVDSPTGKVDNGAQAELFGTFHGVLKPTLLTIIGVMLYIREGWLVGHAGLLGALGVIVLAYVITGTAALSISSITSNVRMEKGGVFTLVGQTLGLEIGGAIGIPLYFAQAMSAAMYLHGMKEGWLSLFPAERMQDTFMAPIVEAGIYESFMVTSFFFCAMGLTLISTRVAFKVQNLVMVFIVVALSSMFLGLSVHEWQTPQLIGDFADGNSFKSLFAVFFPAATGVMVGASMSGSLKDPRRSITKGTLGAWAISFVVYASVAVLAAFLVPTPELISNTTSLIDYARWPLLVQCGLIASCFTATLSSLAAAPRVLQALGEYRIVPRGDLLEQENKGEPRKALIYTGIKVFIVVLLGDLNAIAMILTMFFILAYFTINTVLCIEKSMNLISFRPVFSIPFLVPFLGSFCCLGAMFVINPLMSLVSLGIILAIYIILDRKKLEKPWETVHSGLFGIIANWAAKKVFRTGYFEQKRAWKPDLIMPVEKGSQLEGVSPILKAITYPQGSLQVVALSYEDKASTEQLRGVNQIVKDLNTKGIFATSSLVEARRFSGAVKTAVSVMRGSFFKPNVLFLPIEDRSDEELRDSALTAKSGRMSLVLMSLHQENVFGQQKSVNIWVRDQSPDWNLGLYMTNVDMLALTAYKIAGNWKGKIRLCCAVSKEEYKRPTKKFFKNLISLARLGSNVEIFVTDESFSNALHSVDKADLNIFGHSDELTKQAMEDLTKNLGTTCFFVRGSGIESIMA